MRSPFTHLPESRIAEAVADGWCIDVRELRYLPVGAGAFHWVAHDDGGRRWFVTCDDLTTKPWLGDAPDEVFAGLVAAYAAARSLAEAGAAYVVAPIVGAAGVALRLDGGHSVSVCEHVEGAPGEWGQAYGDHRPIVEVLADLHGRPAVGAATRSGLDLPGRPDLERALGDLREEWHRGPFGEPARLLLRDHQGRIAGWLADLDRASASTSGGPMVVTHGEPHPGNLVEAPDGLRLVDWDTVALAPPERDLWMLAHDPDALAAYTRATGRSLDPALLGAYRLLWALSDLASYAPQLRAEHDDDADAQRAVAALRSILTGEEPAPYGQ